MLTIRPVDRPRFRIADGAAATDRPQQPATRTTEHGIPPTIPPIAIIMRARKRGRHASGAAAHIEVVTVAGGACLTAGGGCILQPERNQYGDIRMPASLTIKNIPDDMLSRLRER